MKLCKAELSARIEKFCRVMDEKNPHWDTALISSKVNQYYFMGTMQDALLVIRKGGEYSYYVRRSHERAKIESPMDNVFPMNTYREAAEREGALGHTYMELDNVPYAMLMRIKSYFDISALDSVDAALSSTRAVKSTYELYWMEKAGKAMLEVLYEDVPKMLREGMSEAEFSAELISGMIKRGHQGITRFSIYQTEIVCGQYGFGENTIFPTSFDGPGGMHGNSAAAPLTGDPGRFLKKGDLVFVDLGFGMMGYHADMTQVYMFGEKPPEEAVEAHRACIDIENRIAAQLIPGAIPSKIYDDIIDSLSDGFKENFMGHGGHSVRFLGHGLGLYINELPVIAQGFDEPLEENMVFALEPKKGIEGVGMVGVEDSYVVTPQGGRLITGGGREIMVV